MKIRKGFVSNSSSSSFVCDICGNAESGYDASPRDLGMLRCQNDHTYCESHYVVDDGMMERLVARFREDGVDAVAIDEFVSEWKSSPPKTESAVTDMIEGVDSQYGDVNYEQLAETCPVCSMQNITDDCIIGYYDRHVKPKSEVVAEIRAKATNFEEMRRLCLGR